ncbi:MAG: cytochrome c oxidase subunit II transmembrane domain-containing protein, partial [Bradyrhizobium sp.]|uniref:cytochrome c oxidase subunit II transmembrane domain-containing protein n=1 Tax=Bradyrhizobium sp. TaxID=376 RepID=UPI003C79DABA
MKVSMGRLGARLVGLTVAGLSLLTSGAAFAEMGQPAPWEYRLQQAATPVMENIIWFHSWLLTIITIITLFVLALLIIVVVKFNARANPVPSRTTHNTLIEVAWTLIPVLVLVGIAVPSFRLLFLELDVPKADLTIKATGKQWYWSYAYPDNGKFEFDSLLAQDKQPRLLGVDNEMVVPVNKVIRVQTTGADVIHSWAVPAFGVKMDAVPGRLNETWF